MKVVSLAQLTRRTALETLAWLEANGRWIEPHTREPLRGGPPVAQVVVRP